MIYLEKIFSSEGKHSQAIEPLLGGKMTKVSQKNTLIWLIMITDLTSNSVLLERE